MPPRLVDLGRQDPETTMNMDSTSLFKYKAKFKLSTTLLVVLMGFSACEPSVPKGRIRIKNDIQDSEYNVVRVSGGGLGASLKPGEMVLMPKGTTSMSFSRSYKTYARSYKVQCPPMELKDSGFQIKLIDVHLNRMKGGCKTVYARKG